MRFNKLATGLGLLAAAAVIASSPARQHAAEESKVLRHVVLFKFQDTATAEQIAEVERAFAGLKSEIDTIQDFEWGIDNSPEGLAQGFTHCFLVTFNSAADRDAYLPHAAHQAFVAKLKPVLEKALVVDYWAKS
ncbi:MAG: Dabb family protein [Planctomycetaceae bacterium]|nr:Dabb family protein [Planctomycetaceae bacterium]